MQRPEFKLLKMASRLVEIEALLCEKKRRANQLALMLRNFPISQVVCSALLD